MELAQLLYLISPLWGRPIWASLQDCLVALGGPFPCGSGIASLPSAFPSPQVSHLATENKRHHALHAVFSLSCPLMKASFQRGLKIQKPRKFRGFCFLLRSGRDCLTLFGGPFPCGGLPCKELKTIAATQLCFFICHDSYESELSTSRVK